MRKIRWGKKGPRAKVPDSSEKYGCVATRERTTKLTGWQKVAGRKKSEEKKRGVMKANHAFQQ